MSLSKNKTKYIKSLKEKKNRALHNTFVAEGAKLVSDLLLTCRCQILVALPEILPMLHFSNAEEVIEANENDLARATLLQTAPQALAVFYIPDLPGTLPQLHGKLSLALDGIQDPGNVGTIIRIADWFGIEQVLCSPDTADLFNPKTVQATMGAIARVKGFQGNLEQMLKINEGLPIFGTFLDGNDLYQDELSSEGIIVFGSEGKGISEEVEELITHKLFIPSYPKDRTTSESLNVAAAAAVVCAEFRRRRK